MCRTNLPLGVSELSSFGRLAFEVCSVRAGIFEYRGSNACSKSNFNVSRSPTSKIRDKHSMDIELNQTVNGSRWVAQSRFQVWFKIQHHGHLGDCPEMQKSHFRVVSLVVDALEEPLPPTLLHRVSSCEWTQTGQFDPGPCQQQCAEHQDLETWCHGGFSSCGQTQMRWLSGHLSLKL